MPSSKLIRLKEEQQLGAKMEALRTCVHCKTSRSQHQQLKCLFDSTSFTPMTLEQWTAFQLEQRSRVGFRTVETQGMAIANTRALQKLEISNVEFIVSVEMADEEPKK
jgi:hypothetical protein